VRPVLPSVEVHPRHTKLGACALPAGGERVPTVQSFGEPWPCGGCWGRRALIRHRRHCRGGLRGRHTKGGGGDVCVVPHCHIARAEPHRTLALLGACPQTPGEQSKGDVLSRGHHGGQREWGNPAWQRVLAAGLARSSPRSGPRRRRWPAREPPGTPCGLRRVCCCRSTRPCSRKRKPIASCK
jgi:hypothetical protein